MAVDDISGRHQWPTLSVLSVIFCLWFRGTFGVVKRVSHRATGETFAAKFLPLKSSTRTRAFQERDLLSRLAHPRVACLLDFFCTRRTLVLVTEMYIKIHSRGLFQCAVYEHVRAAKW